MVAKSPGAKKWFPVMLEVNCGDTLRSRGLGSALTTMHLALEREAGELLGIPETVTQIGLIPVAYYSGETFKPAKRRSVGELTYWNAWKDTTPPA